MADNELPNSGDAPLEPAPVSQHDPSQAPSDEAGAAVEKRLTLRQELAKNFNENREPRELRKPARADPAESKAQAPPRDDRARDETGKFVKQEEKAKEIKAVEVKPPAGTAPKTDVQPGVASTPAGPPPGWSPESKQSFASLPESIKADVLKREKEVSDGFRKYSDDAKRYQEISEVVAPHRQAFQAYGVNSDAEAIRRLFAWENGFRNPQTRMQALNALLQTFQIDPASLAQSPGGYQQQPDASNVLQYVQPLAQQVSSLQAGYQQIVTEKAANEISTFSKDKPNFEKVRQRMGQLIAQGAAPDLETAYQTATWENPEIRDEMIRSQLDAKLAEQQQNQQQRSQQAQRGAVSPSTRAPAAPVSNGKDRTKGVRGSILAAVEELREERA